MDRIAVLKNPIQEYAWGSRTAIPDLLGLPLPAERPAAELWMGSHPSASSQVFMDGKWQPLDRVIERDAVSILGKRVADRFSNKLPFLFKVLAADQPLSIQVHPNLEQARAGFERENRLGIPLDADGRNYKDPNHKPELLCAVTRFEALEGFRPSEEILTLLGRVSDGVLSNELSLLRKAPESLGLKEFFTQLIYMDSSRKRDVVERAAERAIPYADMDRSFWWVVELNRAYPGDIGVLSPLIFNLVVLEPGEAIFVPAGVLHSYLKGVGVELMANSDNVLRGGLTPKHVDAPELVKIVDFRPASVSKILAQPKSQPAERTYMAPPEEFQLSSISVRRDVSFLNEGARSVDILLCMEGDARITELKGGEHENMEKGVSVIVPAAAGRYQIAGKATLYRATVGI
jgi:mannose-6-phosphate isomerase